MRTRWVGSSCAAMLATLVIAGQSASAQSSPAAQPSADSRSGSLSESENPGQQPKVTLEGCLAREVSATAGEAEFVLADARVMPQDAVPIGTAAATAGDPGAAGTAGASAPASDAGANRKPGDKPVPEPTAFRLRGARERGIAAWVGQRVTIVGVLEPDATDRRGGSALATVDASVPADSAAADVKNVEIGGAVTVLSLMPAQKSCAAASD